MRGDRPGPGQVHSASSGWCLVHSVIYELLGAALVPHTRLGEKLLLAAEAAWSNYASPLLLLL